MKLKFIKIISINFFVLVILISIAELLSFLLIRSSKDNYYSAYPDKYDWNIEFHPGVGTAHNKKDFLSNPNSKNLKFENNLFLRKNYGFEPNKIVILALGGSTTDPLGNQFSGDFGTWPELLGSHLYEKKNKANQIINAGIAGATSSQELIRMLTILNYEKPDIVISFNGINVLTGLKAGYIPFGEKNFSSSFINFHKIKEFYQPVRRFLAKNSRIYFLAHKISKFSISNKQINKKYKLDYKLQKLIIDASNKWLRNISLMKLIAEQKNIDYFVFLQPSFGIDLTLMELNNMKEMTNFLGIKKYFPNKMANTISPEYILKINYLYKELRKKCSYLDYCIDLSSNKVFNTDFNLYTDYRHLNKKGNQLMIPKIYNSIFVKD
jgi:lysophospholipase L1-like esterase